MLVVSGPWEILQYILACSRKDVSYSTTFMASFMLSCNVSALSCESSNMLCFKIAECRQYFCHNTLVLRVKTCRECWIISVDLFIFYIVPYGLLVEDWRSRPARIIWWPCESMRITHYLLWNLMVCPSPTIVIPTHSSVLLFLQKGQLWIQKDHRGGNLCFRTR